MRLESYSTRAKYFAGLKRNKLLIIETIVTTQDEVKRINIAPMGAVVLESAFRFFELRPFKATTTFENLEQFRQGVLHITDDCELIVRTALGLPHPDQAMKPAHSVEGQLLSDCCRCSEFTVQHFEVHGDRTCFSCRVEHEHRFRDFLGFNRAKHSLIEAAILATRVEFIPHQEILGQFERHKVIVGKTGDMKDVGLFEEVEAFVNDKLGFIQSSNPLES